jgi:hypothetical protein
MEIEEYINYMKETWFETRTKHQLHLKDLLDSHYAGKSSPGSAAMDIIQYYDLLGDSRCAPPQTSTL